MMSLSYIRHPELVSGSPEILKQVQDDDISGGVHV